MKGNDVSQKASLVTGGGILGDTWHLERQVAGRGHGTVQEMLSKGQKWFKAGGSIPPSNGAHGVPRRVAASAFP